LDTYVLLEEKGLDGVVKGRDIDEVISFLIKTKSFVFKLGWEGVLDEKLQYRETERKVIFPEDLHYDKTMLLDGMHTYNSSEHYEVIDIKTRRFNLLNFVMRIVGKFLRR
jgi:hypothetical protein